MASHDKRTSVAISAMLKDVWNHILEEKGNSYGYLCPNCERILDIQEHYDGIRCTHLITVSCSECNIFVNNQVSDLALGSMALDRKSLFNIVIEKMLSRLVDPIRQTELELEAEARAECDFPF